MFHGGSQELGVVNSAVTIGVSTLENSHEFVGVLALAEALLEFIKRNGTVTVIVKLLKDGFQVLNIFRVSLNSDSHQSRLLQFLTFLESLHVAQIKFLEKFLVSLLFGHFLDPFVLQCFLRCQASFRLADKLLDQVFGLLADLVPLLTVEIELSFLHHGENFLVIVSIKWWVTA